MKRLIAVLLSMLLLLNATLALAEDEAYPSVICRTKDVNACAGFSFPEDAELLEVIFPQILNCDAALIRHGDTNILIDCCNAGQSKRLGPMLVQLGITRIDAVINTHPHPDHLEGILGIAQVFEVGEVWLCYPEDAEEGCTAAVLPFLKDRQIPVIFYEDGDTLTFGAIELKSYRASGEDLNMNDTSMQLHLTYGERTMLFSADLTQKAQMLLAESAPDELLQADVLKYPHHGKQALTEGYVQKVQPQLTVITNVHGDTCMQAIKFCQLKRITFVTTVPGFVHLTTDGTTWLCDRIAVDKTVTYIDPLQKK